jgi:hypothetical protein
LHKIKADAKGSALEYIDRSAVPIKVARGEPVAQDIVPFQGERATRSLLGLPTHRCRPPAFPEPEPDGSALDRAAPPPPFDVHGAFDTRVLDAFETRVGGAHKRNLPKRAAMTRLRMSDRLLSHTNKPRSYSKAEKLWKAPEFSNPMPRVFGNANYAEALDGTLVSVPPRLPSSEEEFDRLSVRELMTRSLEPGQQRSGLGTAWSSRSPSRDELRSSASRVPTGPPAWAKTNRKNTTIIGDPSKKSSTCIIEPLDSPKAKVSSFVKLPDGWMAKVPNLGRVTDPFCHDLCSRPLYCFDLDQARNRRELHMKSSLGVYTGGPVYNINFSQAIQKF